MTVSNGRKVSAILVPWVFLVVFATLYIELMIPRIRDGHLVAWCVGAFAGMVFVVFFVAAITFSRDVLQNRWP